MPINHAMGESSVEIAGTERPLTFNFETFEQIGQKLGLDEFGDVVTKIAADFQGKTIGKTFWIVLIEAMREHWPEVDAPAVRRALKPRDMERVATALVAALNAAMPQPEVTGVGGAKAGEGAKPASGPAGLN
jgi:hypothetical protein